MIAADHAVFYMDEPKVRLGVMLADTDLMGIPHRLVVGDRGLEQGTVEYKGRRDPQSQHIEVERLISFVKERVGSSVVAK